ncbi:MAG: tRNA (N(6)-L-threonylcarbamoyladenosine(37)-C(2))-methylthiotransferase MtaB [Clostridia bacterium]|nr:tRNA (N(6)-L-threonylcarbamoyladenosine(37)-C(2))-methylthiotransferase MtaB [Clostridia bacterium]
MKQVGFYTLGCKVSQYETEAIAENFEKHGYKISDFNEACDLYVINTCTVTAEADRKSRQIIRRAKRKSPSAKIIVCGCYSQRSPEEVLSIPDVDAVIGSSGKMELVGIAERLLSGEGKISNVTDIDTEPFEPMKITRGPRTRVYVKIEDGCECKCTYCAIPSARGPVRSKPREDVIREVEELSRSGIREIVLTGIETGSYGADFREDYRLADLLIELNERQSAEQIRLGSLAPELVGKDFVEKVKDLKILAPHFHLSIQSGSDKILRAMKRRYNRAMALENIERIRKSIPCATFTTDIMVGFPGESDDDFCDTLDFVKEAKFLDAHVFAYSRRKNTPAESYPDQIDEATKKERSEILIGAIKDVRLSTLRDIVASKNALSCIFEEKRGKAWYGHSSTFAEVLVESDTDLHGVKKEVMPISLDGEFIVGKLL